ncbi:hypothetical protein ABH926_007797 [Catenulispora sp. GP43]|uniref:phosphotransferase n=1 Tax=Catenulispora sp. GP43 TaxID=3156263 RepID=UPI00351175A0
MRPDGPDLSDQPDDGTGWLGADWLEKAVTRTDGLLARHGYRRTGVPIEIRRWSVSAVLRVPTDREPVWYKAVPPVFAHEGRVTAWLAETVPDLVPTVLGHGDGWLVTTEMPTGDEPSVGHPIDDVLRLQRTTIGRAEEILALGCPDRTPSRACASVAALAQRRDLLGADLADHVDVLLPALDRRVAEISTLSMPSTLVHGDVNGANSRWTGRGWMHIDWTDACLAHPVVELAQPLIDATAQERRALESRFDSAWSDLVPAAQMRRVLAEAPLLGAAHQAGTYLSIIDGVGPANDHPDMLRFWTRRLVETLQ